jgi:glutathione synthase/RimK-type ligase-like ATP-grasp enzyme
MKIGIHLSKNSFSDRWVAYCEAHSISYKIVNCYKNDIIQQLEDCDALMWHFHHAGAKDFLFVEQLLFAVQFSGKKVFPDFNSVWHFDDKVAQKYLLEAMHIPLVKSYVFYSKPEALEWLAYTAFPKVFKLRGGAGSVNVKLVRSATQASAFVSKAFGKGFKHDSQVPLGEIYKKYRRGKLPFLSVAKGIVRKFIPTEYAKIHGKERGYVYFQDFIPGNDHDIRVIVICDKAFAIKRMVRENDFRASGSGYILYDKELFDLNSIQLSFEIAKKLKTQCVALDYVYDNGSPMVVEISYGFSMVGYDPCPGYWDSKMQWHEGKFNPYGWMIEEILRTNK